LAVALAEMALAGGIGARLRAPAGPPSHAFWFGEDQARYVVAVAAAAADAGGSGARAAGVPLLRLGETGGTALTLGDAQSIVLAELKAAFEGWLPTFMAGTV
uniref:AIR synthase-related protein n=1 Tax=Methylocella sp. TaxID=1978226 RepID=UPI0037838812